MLYVYAAKYVFTAIYMLAIITHAIDHLLPEPETSIQPTIVDPPVNLAKMAVGKTHQEENCGFFKAKTRKATGTF